MSKVIMVILFICCKQTTHYLPKIAEWLKKPQPTVAAKPPGSKGKRCGASTKTEAFSFPQLLLQKLHYFFLFRCQE